MKTKSRSTRRNFGSLRVDDEHAHHAHRHLHHLVGVRVIHEGPALPEHELVDEGLARWDMRLSESADAIHSVGQAHAVPMHGGVLGQFVGYENADLVALDGFDRRTGRLAVVAPQIHLHPRREFTHDRFGYQMKFLPITVHAPRQRPAVQCHDWLVILTTVWCDRRPHCG